MRRSIVLPLAAVLLLALSAAPARAQRADPVATTLAGLAVAPAPYTPAEVAVWTRDWQTARSSVRRLGGSARANLAGVIANTTSLAKRRLLAGRARPAFATVRHNLEWFVEQRRATPASGTRFGFGTDVVWQLYAGSGWQLQPLGSFGALNGLLRRRTRAATVRIRALANDLLPLAVSRRGFLAWEYLFPWDGAAPGWVSGMAQATGMQALSGAGVRLGDQSLVATATAMRGAFETPPPWGVRLVTAPGRAQFLLYSGSPRLLVGNGFAQALLGLDRYRELSGDGVAAALVGEGLAEARAAFPLYDTGAWSLYSRSPTGPGRESDLHYHELFTGFLGEMCTRFADPVFCGLDQRFLAYEQAPIAIARLRATARGRRLDVNLRVSKRGTVRVTVLDGARTIGSASRALLRGPERYVFALPRRHGALSVVVDAVSLNGIASQAQAAVGTRRPTRG